jgi:hypothetical protein
MLAAIQTMADAYSIGLTRDLKPNRAAEASTGVADLLSHQCSSRHHLGTETLRTQRRLFQASVCAAAVTAEGSSARSHTSKRLTTRMPTRS